MADDRRGAPVTAVRVLAPAKLNLGLEIVARRPDGYHNIDTIMGMVDLADVITLRAVDTPGLTIHGMSDVPLEGNLMTKALRQFCQRAGVTLHHEISIEKHIPSPAGMGGGSSDAAAVLRAANALHGEPLTHAELIEIAAIIGADCPFFLAGPAARARGIGHDLAEVPAPEGWAVIAAPPTDQQAKTAALYRALQPADFSDGKHITTVQQALENGRLPAQPLHNAFTRPTRDLMGGVADTIDAFAEVAGSATLTGAGPAMYTITDTQEQAALIAGRLRDRLTGVPIYLPGFLTATPAVETLP